MSEDQAREGIAELRRLGLMQRLPQKHKGMWQWLPGFGGAEDEDLRDDEGYF